MLASNSVTVPDDDGDPKLLAAWLDGDRGAGEELVARHYKSIFQFFNTRLNPDTAADLTQSTLETLCERGDQYRGASSFRAYLLGIARWKLVAHFRRAEARVLADAPFSEALIPAPDARSMTSLWAQRERESAVVIALRRLPLDYQLILELKDYEGLTAREIAEVFGIPAGTVATRLRRARQQLATVTDHLLGGGLAETTATALADYMRQLRRAAGRQ